LTGFTGFFISSGIKFNHVDPLALQCRTPSSAKASAEELLSFPAGAAGLFIVIYKPVFVKLINAKIVIQTAVGSIYFIATTFRSWQ
jgi:hypothetical protein